MNESEIFMAALDRNSPQERAEFLDSACAENPQLRQRVETLLAAHSTAGSLFDHPAVAGIATQLLSDTADRLAADAADSRTLPDLDEIPLDFLEPSPQPGSLGRLGQYEILEVVGRGGMGIVLKAQDIKLNRIVAVKVLAPELAANPTARKRFLREAQAAAAVSHDHVVTTYAVEENEAKGRPNLPYLVMGFIDGHSLQQKLDREGALPLNEILRIGRQIAAGLAAAHGQGLIHRDVKPSNILLQNGVQRVQITDFGLARAVDDVGMTRTGEITGTPQYMSPEQAQGQSVDARSDLFSLGSVMYAMCTGRGPFRADTTVASLRRVCDDTPRPIREVTSDIPDWLVAIIDRLLQKDPDDRFQTAEEVADLLGRHLAHLQDPRSTPFPGTLRALPRRAPSCTGARRHGWAVTGLVLFVLAVSLGVTEATGMTQISSSVISFVRGDGMLSIEVNDPQVSVTIEGDDVVIKGAGPQEVRLNPGEYHLTAERDGVSVPLERELVSIARGGREVVRVTLQPEPTAARETDYRSIPAGAITELRRFHSHQKAIHGIAFAPDGTTAYSASGDGTVISWDVSSGEVLRTWSDGKKPFSALAVSQDGQTLAACEFSGRIWLLDLSDWHVIRSWIGHQDKISTMGVTFAGNSLITLSHDRSARQWNVNTGQETGSLVNPDGHMLGVGATPDGTLALTTGQNAQSWLWDLKSRQVVLRLEPTAAAWCAAILPGGDRGVAGHQDGKVRLWDLTDGHIIRTIPAHTTAVSYIAVTSDGRHCISSSWDNSLKIFELASGRKVAEVVTKTHCTRVFCLAPDGRTLLSGGGNYHDKSADEWVTDGDYDLRLWQLPESVWPAEADIDDAEAGVESE